MSECNINHSREDVINKLESQKTFLPGELYERMQKYLDQEHTQDLLNEVFHLLKKYDLVSEEEREARNNRMLIVLSN